jgi:hypothetical protein
MASQRSCAMRGLVKSMRWRCLPCYKSFRIYLISASLALKIFFSFISKIDGAERRSCLNFAVIDVVASKQ